MTLMSTSGLSSLISETVMPLSRAICMKVSPACTSYTVWPLVLAVRAASMAAGSWFTSEAVYSWVMYTPEVNSADTVFSVV